MNRPLPPDADSDPLAELPRALDPPPGLEDRVIGDLRRRGLLGASPPSGRRPRWWMTAAACLLAALGGWAIGGSGRTPGAVSVGVSGEVAGEAASPAPQAGEKQYLLLLVEPRPLTTDKPQATLVGEYRSWAAELARQGRLVSAARLDEGQSAYLAESPRPPAGIAQVTGFFVLRSSSLAEAEAIAGTCPHVGYGGEISVRELAGTADPPASAAVTAPARSSATS